jgi:YVTN family beta-propeller protein
MKNCFAFVTGFALLAMAAAPVPAYAEAAPWISPLDVVAGKAGATLYIAQEDGMDIAFFDVAQKKLFKGILLPQPPAAIALSPDEKTLYAAGAAPDGMLHVINLESGEITASIPSGHTPSALAVAPDGSRVYVANRFDNEIAIIDPVAGKVTGTIPMQREPIALAITPDGKSLVALNHLPAGPSDGDYTAAVIAVIDTASGKIGAEINLPNGSTGLRGVCMSPDGRYAYATHILGRYHLPTTQLERGWMNTNAMTVVDVPAGKRVNTFLLDSVDLGAANPWGVTVSADGKWLCATHAGTHEVSVIDRAALHQKLDKVAAGEAVTEVSQTPEDVPNDLSFLVDIRRRIRLTGNGPRGAAMTGTQVWIAEYFTGTLGHVDINPEIRPKAESIALGQEPELTPERIGERHFNDAALCFQHWQSCASCHPDVRADALNWDLLNDGIGNPKNTKSMLFAHMTPPAMVSGIRGDAETAVRAGIRHIQFAVRPEEDAEAIDAFLKALRPMPSPELENGARSAQAEQGKALFDSAGCASCHSGEYYTNLELYNVGTGIGREADWKFDTPTLREVWRTAPYLHDGRAATLKEVLTVHNPEDKHGKTSQLSPEEIDALTAYISSL